MDPGARLGARQQQRQECRDALRWCIRGISLRRILRGLFLLQGLDRELLLQWQQQLEPRGRHSRLGRQLRCLQLRDDPPGSRRLHCQEQLGHLVGQRRLLLCLLLRLLVRPLRRDGGLRRCGVDDQLHRYLSVRPAGRGWDCLIFEHQCVVRQHLHRPVDLLG